jgi:uncharacterized protein (DUF1015 family)
MKKSLKLRAERKDMAELIPFRAIRYNPDIIRDPAEVAAPPYDVISPEEQRRLHERHPNNIIRLILGEPKAGDTPFDNRHTRAAGYFKEWLSQRILVRDLSPAFYLTSVDFTLGDRRLTRFGLIGRVRLEPFERKIILPHEKTFSKVKSERLELRKACKANFSPIFSLFADRDSVFDMLKKEVLNRPPESDFLDDRGDRQRMWRIEDPALQRKVSLSLAGSKIYIADGHHRYETALNYREYISAISPGLSPEHPANYVMMYLSGIEDPGLVILPAHRLLRGIPGEALSGLLGRLETCFDIERFRGAGRADFLAALKADPESNSIGLFLKGYSEFHLLRLKPEVMEKRFGSELPVELRELDVTVLTRLIQMDMLGFDHAGLDDEKKISYTSDEILALEAVAESRFDIAFILNPTRIDQVRRIALEGLIMPRKSTFFFPKVITGQAINPLFT